jgi:lysophospholipase L1-like esterase
MRGESFVFENTKEYKFFGNIIPKKIIKVISYNKNVEKKRGGVVKYQENIDFIINYKKGTIRRTINSKIPNYINYKIKYDKNNKFHFYGGEKRNPPLNIPFQVFIDYSYDNDNDIIKSKAYMLEYADRLENDVLNVILIGDSIGESSDTEEHYLHNNRNKNNFMTYIKNTFNTLYKNKLHLKNYSKGGTSVEYLKKRLGDIVNEKPDIVIVEFGMNGHLWGSNNFDKWKSIMNTTIQELIFQDIQPILIGFPQQNRDWYRENKILTLMYNSALKRIAKDNYIPFVDIYIIFRDIENKSVIKDIMADNIHHPNSFGHKIYYNAILPFFLKEDTSSINISNFIKLEENYK